MTEEQLIQNIAKSNNQYSNYTSLVRQDAYHRMVNYNNSCKYYNRIIDNLRRLDKLTDGTRKYNKKNRKLVYITKYTKKFRYMSYRQALAIGYKTLEKDLAKNLEFKDVNLQWHYERSKREQQYVYCEPEDFDEVTELY